MGVEIDRDVLISRKIHSDRIARPLSFFRTCQKCTRYLLIARSSGAVRNDKSMHRAD